MAATLASVCSVPLTSVLLLFELTKDYRILLPLMVMFYVTLLAFYIFGISNIENKGMHEYTFYCFSSLPLFLLEKRKRPSYCD